VAGLVQGFWRYWALKSSYVEFLGGLIRIQNGWQHELLRRKMAAKIPYIRRVQQLTMAAIARGELLSLRKKQFAAVSSQKFYRAARLLRFLQRYNFIVTGQKFIRAYRTLRAARRYVAAKTVMRSYTSYNLYMEWFYTEEGYRKQSSITRVQSAWRQYSQCQSFAEISTACEQGCAAHAHGSLHGGRAY